MLGVKEEKKTSKIKNIDEHCMYNPNSVITGKVPIVSLLVHQSQLLILQR